MNKIFIMAKVVKFTFYNSFRCEKNYYHFFGRNDENDETSRININLGKIIFYCESFLIILPEAFLKLLGRALIPTVFTSFFRFNGNLRLYIENFLTLIPEKS